MSAPFPDARVVLKHLNDLGYCNISAQTLKEFCTDLKRVYRAKYQSQAQDTENTEAYVNLTLQSARHETSTASSFESETSSSTSLVLQDIINISVNSSNNSHRSTTSQSSSSTSNFSTNSIDIPDFPKKKTQPERTPTTTSTTEATKPYSAFIRPWHLSSKPSKTHSRGSPNLLTDPVELYHRYQAIWKQQKIPGNDNHGDLRWSIRQRMMGSDVYPKPTFRASSTELRRNSKNH